LITISNIRPLQILIVKKCWQDRPSLGFFPLSIKTINISPKLNVEDLNEMRRIHMEWRGLNKNEEDLNEMGRFETE
jgi:hypothetical protein